jgi:hypothetical protein
MFYQSINVRDGWAGVVQFSLASSSQCKVGQNFLKKSDILFALFALV